MPPDTVVVRLAFARPKMPASALPATDVPAFQPNVQPCVSVCETCQLTLFDRVVEPPCMFDTDVSHDSSHVRPSVRVRVSVWVSVYDTVLPLVSPPERQPESGLAGSICAIWVSPESIYSIGRWTPIESCILRSRPS